MVIRFLIIALVMMGWSCRDAEVSAPEQLPSPDAPHFESGGDVGIGDSQPGDLIPIPEPDSRTLRRVDIDQLGALFLGATEGIYWSDTNAPGGDDLLEELAGTLGVPDYAVSTYEDLEPNLIFQKYLGDAARSICWQLAEREQDPNAVAILFEKASSEDTWESAPEEIDENLSQLLLRFHGRSTVESPESLELWRWLFQSAYHLSEDTMVAWRTVCVGLITHPDFYLH